MKPYGQEALSVQLEQLTCLTCYQYGNFHPLAKGVICPNCGIDLCWPCMNKHLITEELCYQKMASR